jgi:hypothetical protein
LASGDDFHRRVGRLLYWQRDSKNEAQGALLVRRRRRPATSAYAVSSFICLKTTRFCDACGRTLMNQFLASVIALDAAPTWISKMLSARETKSRN